MLSTIRHFQKWLMIVVAIIIIISFAFLYNPGDPSRKSDSNVINVNGTALSSKEAIKLRSAFNIMLQIGMSDFAIFLYGQDRQDTDYTDFAVNLALFREEAKRLGIQPTPQQVRDAASSLPGIAMNRIDQKTLERQILNPNGYSSADFFELVSDYVCFKEVRSLLTSGIEPLDSEIEALYENDYATIHGSLINIPRAPLEEKAKAEITDKDIADHFAANSDRYQSKRKRAVDLIRFERAEPAADATQETIAKAALDYTRTVDEVSGEFEPDGSNFDAVVKKHNLKVEALDPFAPDETPESLKGDPQLTEMIFSPAVVASRPVSDPLKLADGNYVMLHLREDVEPSPLDLAAATEQIKDELLAEKTAALIDSTVAEARAKITEALDAGKTIAEAAKAAGYEAKALTPFTSSEPPADVESAGQIAQMASSLNPGSLSTSTIDNEVGSALVYIEKKELVDSDDEANRKSTVRTNLIAGQSNQLMRAWFRNRIDEAEIWTHYRLKDPNTSAESDESGTEGEPVDDAS